MAISLDYKFKWGKFKGKTLEEAIKDDFKTIRFYKENYGWFVMDDEAYKFYIDYIKNYFGTAPDDAK
jgi:hypothetical protein